jgi:hypothetical protein
VQGFALTPLLRFAAPVQAFSPYYRGKIRGFARVLSEFDISGIRWRW